MDSVSMLSRSAWPATAHAPLAPAWLCNASELSAQHVLARSGWIQTHGLHRAGRALAAEAEGGGLASSHLGDPATVALGCVAFAAFVVLNSVERVPLMPVGRTGSSLVGALLMIVFRVVPTESVLAGLGKNIPLLALVWGTIVLSHALAKHGALLRGMEALCTWRTLGAWDACARLSLATSVLSAFIGWDVGALIMSPLALKIPTRYPGQSEKPFLAAVATGANAGSLLTPIANPGNVIVTLASGMPFVTFVRKMAAPWALAVVINAAVVVASYGNHFFLRPQLTLAGGPLPDPQKVPQGGMAAARLSSADGQVQASESESSTDGDPTGAPGSGSPSTASTDSEGRAGAAQQDAEADQNQADCVADSQKQGRSPLGALPEEAAATATWLEQASAWASAAKENWRGIFVYAVWAACLAFWFAGEELGAVAICGGIAVVLAEGKPAAESVVESADWPVIVYIAGILIVIPAFDETGVMTALWEWLVGAGVISVVEPLGLAMLVLVITFFTNVVTNVPAVLMLGARVAAFASEELQTVERLSADSSSAAMRGWLLVAFIAAMAGSFTVQGSITQVIAYDIGKEARSGSVGFVEHLRVGVPATVLTIAVGLPLLLGEDEF